MKLSSSAGLLLCSRSWVAPAAAKEHGVSNSVTPTPGTAYESNNGVMFTYVGTFKDKKQSQWSNSCAGTSDRHTTFFKSFGYGPGNSDQMLDTCSDYCANDVSGGTTSKYGTKPYTFFAVQHNTWCSCTDKLDLAIPPSNEGANAASHKLWGGNCENSIWMKTYDTSTNGGCPGSYEPVVRSGGTYIGNPPDGVLTQEDAAACAAKCDADATCVGIETNGELCKLVLQEIDWDAEQNLRPKATFVLCKRMAPPAPTAEMIAMKDTTELAAMVVPSVIAVAAVEDQKLLPKLAFKIAAAKVTSMLATLNIS